MLIGLGIDRELGVGGWRGDRGCPGVRKCHLPPLFVAWWSWDQEVGQTRLVQRFGKPQRINWRKRDEVQQQPEAMVRAGTWSQARLAPPQPPGFSWYHIKLQHGSFKEGKKERVRGLNRALSIDLKVCTGSSGGKSCPFKCDWAWLTWGSMVILSTVLFWGLVSVFTVRKERSHFVSQSTEPNIPVVVYLGLSVWFSHLNWQIPSNLIWPNLIPVHDHESVNNLQSVYIYG